MEYRQNSIAMGQILVLQIHDFNADYVHKVGADEYSVSVFIK